MVVGVDGIHGEGGGVAQLLVVHVDHLLFQRKHELERDTVTTQHLHVKDDLVLVQFMIRPLDRVTLAIVVV